jgi:transposase
MSYCPYCLQKDIQIYDLKAKIKALQQKLNQQERSAKEQPFGSSTPSSKVLLKPNAKEDKRQLRGGGKPGHVGHGREAMTPDQADRVERVKTVDVCPECGTPLINKGSRSRTVIDCKPMTKEKIILRLEKKRCPKCRCHIEASPAGVLPKCQYGNNLLTHVAMEHYVHGTTLGQLEKRLGIGYGSLVAGLHFLARLFEKVPARLIMEYRLSLVKHADETGWRNDGYNGYGWLYATADMSIFRFRATRSAAVVREVLGTAKRPGVLVVDRYNAYNKVPCRIQYCYAHLLRNVQDLEDEFPDNEEIRRFVTELAPLLSSAMSLRRLPLSKRQFRRQARQIKRAILKIVNTQAQHPGIQGIQNIFREKKSRLFHWAEDPLVPADNNLAERDLRPLVIARKISFGSQSDAGAKTREILMTVLHTLKKRSGNVELAFKSALDKIAADPTVDRYVALFKQAAPASHCNSS